MFNLNKALNAYVKHLSKSLIVVDLMVERVKSKQMTEQVNKLIRDIEAGITRDQVVVDKLFAKHDCSTHKPCPMTALACRRTDDLQPITALRIYDLTNDYERDYLYIQPEDPAKMKDHYNEPEFYDYLLDAEHDPDGLIALGYQPVLGMAEVYAKEDLKHSDGTFYRTSTNGGIFASEQCFTYYCDGFTIWLTQLDDKYWDRLTFDYNNNLYIKISDQRKHDWDLLKEAHDKVAQVQKELANLKQQQG